MTYRAWNTKTVDRAALKELTAAIAQQNTEELEYQNMDEEWSEEKYRSVLAAQQKEAGLLAGILAARGITDPAEALTLLAGEEELSDPMLLTETPPSSLQSAARPCPATPSWASSPGASASPSTSRAAPTRCPA